LDQLASQPDGDRCRQQELELLLALARALIAGKGYAAPAVGETFARARVLAEQLDRSDHLVGLFWGQAAFHTVRSELRLALSLAEQMETLGETQKDVALRLLGHYQHGVIRLFLGEFAVARALFEQCDRLDDPAHRAVYAALTAEHPYAVKPGQLAVTLTPLGYIDQGRSRLDAALTVARRLGHVYSLAFVLNRAALIELATGSPHEAQRHVEEMVALSNEHGFPFYLAWGTVHRGTALTALGQAQEGLTLIIKGLSMFRATGAVAGTPWMLTNLAEAHRRLGQSGEGLNCLAEAAQIIEATDERRDEAELHRVRGDLVNATGDQGTTEQSYHKALVVARRQGAKLFELRAATSLARLSLNQGKPTETRDLLAPIYGWFTEGFDTPVLKEAKGLLDDLG
jgi:tetratricopeptide (TPR) repeat protein